MADFQLFLSWLWSVLNLLPIVISGSFILFFSFIIFVMRRWVFPLIHKLKN